MENYLKQGKTQNMLNAKHVGVHESAINTLRNKFKVN